MELSLEAQSAPQPATSETKKKIIATGMPLNANNWGIHLKIASLSIQWVNIVLSFQTQNTFNAFSTV